MRWGSVEHTRFFANFLALLSLLFLNNSITLRSYGANPATSLTISRTNAVRLLKWPLVREIRGLRTRGVVFYNVFTQWSADCLRKRSKS